MRFFLFLLILGNFSSISFAQNIRCVLPNLPEGTREEFRLASKENGTYTFQRFYFSPKETKEPNSLEEIWELTCVFAGSDPIVSSCLRKTHQEHPLADATVTILKIETLSAGSVNQKKPIKEVKSLRYQLYWRDDRKKSDGKRNFFLGQCKLDPNS